MATPLITFKAGVCEVDTDTKPYKVVPTPTQGYVYVYSEDDLVHFCWRERSKPMDDEDNLDLITVPSDCTFEPYENHNTNGRIFVLRFSSSSQRHLFWMQSKSQKANDPGYFSFRDLKIGQIVNTLLQGEEVDVSAQIAQIPRENGGDDEDETMEDVEGHGDSADHHRAGSGGAGAGATGGDVRDEGAGAREGGADGGRAAGSGPTDAATVVQNFLASLKGGQGMQQQQQTQGQIYTTLPDLLPFSTTIPTLDHASPAEIDSLLSYLPPTVLIIAQESAASIDGMVEPTPAAANAAMEALSLGQKKSILKKVLRSPQFHQSLGSLTMAIRDGGLPSIAEALGIKLQNDGLIRGGSMPLGGGDAVEAFVEGCKKTVEGEKK